MLFDLKAIPDLEVLRHVTSIGSRGSSETYFSHAQIVDTLLDTCCEMEIHVEQGTLSTIRNGNDFFGSFYRQDPIMYKELKLHPSFFITHSNDGRRALELFYGITSVTQRWSIYTSRQRSKLQRSQGYDPKTHIEYGLQKFGSSSDEKLTMFLDRLYDVKLTGADAAETIFDLNSLDIIKLRGMAITNKRYCYNATETGNNLFTLYRSVASVNAEIFVEHQYQNYTRLHDFFLRRFHVDTSNPIFDRYD